MVHRITTIIAGDINASLTSLSNGLDVFILNACSPSSCMAYGNTSAEYKNAPPGTYYIVVDGYNEASGPYTLAISYPGAFPGVQFSQTT